MKNKIKTYTSLVSLACLSLSANAAVLLDFGSQSVEGATGTDTYNVIANSPTTGAGNPLGTSANGATSPGYSGSALLDNTGTTTGIGFTLNAFTNGNGQLRGFDSANTATFAGLENFAVQDGFLVNNHNGNGTASFGLNLTFNGLTAGTAYNLSVIGGSGANDPSVYSVTTGTGDNSVGNVAATLEGTLIEFTNVFADANGEITLTDLVNSVNPDNENFQNTIINFASIEAVPEPSSTALLGLGGLALLARRRR